MVVVGGGGEFGCVCFTPNTRIFCAYIVTCCNSLWFPALFLIYPHIDIMETDISSILMVT